MWCGLGHIRASVQSLYRGNVPWQSYLHVVSASVKYRHSVKFNHKQQVVRFGLLTDSSSNLTCSTLRTSFNFASFSALLPSSSTFCCLAFSCCRFSISCRLFCWPLDVLWLKVLMSPPNNLCPRFRSSCTWLLRLSVVKSSVDFSWASFAGSAA